MKREPNGLKYLVLLILLSLQLKAQAQDPILPGLTGEKLLIEVINAYKPSSVLSYGNARDLMYGTIYNQNDSVSCVYTGHTLFLPNNVDPSTFLYMNGGQDGINNEHTYPRSKGADSNNGDSDMHHLFPSKSSVNAARGNLPFGNIADSQTDTWYYRDQSQDAVPDSNIDLYSERTSEKFEPREDHKGNVARAIFYFFTMYQNDAVAADPNFFESQRLTLCEWHTQDPADALEIERTNMIANYQSGLANPFVLDPSLATRAFCKNVVVATEPLLESGLSISPNPVRDTLEVLSQGASELLVTDLFGRVHIRKHFTDKITIDFSPLHSGAYLISVNGKVSKIIKR